METEKKIKYKDIFELIKKIGVDPNYADYQFEIGEMVKMMAGYVSMIQDLKFASSRSEARRIALANELHHG